MRMKHPVFLALLFIIMVPDSFAQIKPEFRENFVEAESEYLFEEYAEALPDYEVLIRQYPDNDNINYKIGVCLLNNPYRKEESISYLEKAVQNINLKYKENNYRETEAPLEAYFYLGNAYRINNQLEKAIETYSLFKEQADEELYDLELVDEQIRACSTAMELMTRPVDIDMENMGDVINTRFAESNFVVSGDETALAYIQELAFYDAPFFAEKVDGEWSYPRNLIASQEFGEGVDDDVYPVALSYHGDEMIIYRSDNFIGDLYSSKFVDGFWTPIQKLNDNINTKYWESHACFTITGDTLYFTSNRKGGYGGLDIFISVRGEDGEWGIPENLGPEINTKYNEESPYITADGRTLYFSSYGHYNMGGYDVFYSTRLDDGKWSVPVNAGYPINTTDDDMFFVPVRNGTFAYFPRFREDSYGLTDIYLLEIYSDTHPRKFRIRGILAIQDRDSFPGPVHVSVIERSARDTVAKTVADHETGEFTFESTAGQYDLLIEGKDIETTVSQFEIPEGYREKEMEMEEGILLTPARPAEPVPAISEHIVVRDTLIPVETGNSIDIRLTLEQNARLYVETYHDSAFVRLDSFDIENRDFNLEYIPVPGDNLLRFKMISAEDSLSLKDIHVIYTEPPVPAEEAVAELPEPVKVEEGTLLLQTGLASIATGALQDLLEGLDLAAAGISTQEDLLKYLREHADEYNYDTQDVHDLILANMKVEYLQDYLDEMIRITEDDSLRRALEETDIAREGIQTLQELYRNIHSKTEAYGFEGNTVNELFSLLSQRVELDELIENLSAIATGDLKMVIDDLDVDSEGIRNPADFMSHLLRESENHAYGREDAMALLLDYLEEEDLGNILRMLVATSSGDLQTLLINLSLEQQNIKNLNHLYEYLVNQTTFYDFTDTDVMELFLNLVSMIEKQPLVEEIQPPPPPPPPAKQRYGRTWQLYVLGGLLLSIILFFILRKKKSEKDKNPPANP